MSIKIFSAALTLVLVAIALNGKGSLVESRCVHEKERALAMEIGAKELSDRAAYSNRDNEEEEHRMRTERTLRQFQDDLRKIVYCYYRLSCPRRRTEKVMKDCEEIKDWPLYHQFMRMSRITRYPYHQFAPAPVSRIEYNSLQPYSE